MAVETTIINSPSTTKTQERYFPLSKIESLEKDYNKVTNLIGSIHRLAENTGKLSQYIYKSELNQILEEKHPVDMEKHIFMELVRENRPLKDLRCSYITYMKVKMEFVRKVIKLYTRLNRDYIAFHKVNTSKKPSHKSFSKPKSKIKIEKKGKQATLLNWK